MQSNDSAQEAAEVVGVKVKAIRRAGIEDVYCLAVEKNRNMIANGIIVSNCDALRYMLFTVFGHKKNLKFGDGPVDGRALGGSRQF